MTHREGHDLVKMNDAGLTVSDPREDIRGRTVVAKDGEKIGKIDGLIIDADQKVIRFLEVGSGGFLGIGEDKVLIPVDAIVGLDEDEVRVDQTSDRIVASPKYDPALAEKGEYWSNVSQHYGFLPFWAPGYTKRDLPFRQRPNTTTDPRG